MVNYTSNNGTFVFSITNNTNYAVDNTDTDIILSAFNKWDSLITVDSRFTNHVITISYIIESLETGVLGSAGIQSVNYISSQTFGNTVPLTANLTMNKDYLPGLISTIRDDGKSSLYYVILHEIGHILGIGNFWYLSGVPKTSYDDNGVTKYYYTGTNAFREYKSYFTTNSNLFLGIPIEDDGGAGTEGAHPEEGYEGTLSNDNRYINDVYHPGLDTELMTGWLDSNPTVTPLSRITLGFLEDIGYNVNYNLADLYIEMTWPPIAEANNLEQTYIKTFLDVSGDLTSHRFFVLNDVSMGKAGTTVDICGNLNAQYPDNSIPANAISGLGEVTPNFAGPVEMSDNLDICGNFLRTQAISLGGHIIPTTNAAYDLGNAENKIRHLFLSDNSLWVGDQHKIDSNDGKMKFKKRDVNKIPVTIAAAGGVQGGAETSSSKTIDNMTLQDWIIYAKTLPSVNGKDGDNITIQDIFTDDADFEFIQDANVSSQITSQDLDLGSNKIRYSNVFTTIGDLPDASTYHGMFAHVHDTGNAYYSHAGNWVQLGNIVSPEFTGQPTAPTATGNTNNTQIATTAFVQDSITTNIASKANIAAPSFTGNISLGDHININGRTISSVNTDDGNIYLSPKENATSGGQVRIGLTGGGGTLYADRMLSNYNSNIMYGTKTLESLVSGGYNIAVGFEALNGATTAQNNVALGTYAGKNNRTGSNNTLIGTHSNFSNISEYNHSTALGYGSQITASNQIVLGRAVETVEILGNVNIATGTSKTATAPTVSGTSDSTTNIATTAFVQAVVATVDAGSMAANISAKANKASPTFTGVPTAPTAASNINNIQIATTAFVQERITTLIGGAPAALDTLKEITDALTGADNTAGAITTTIADNATAITDEAAAARAAETTLQTNIADNATAITDEAAAARAAETTLQTNINNLNSSVSGGSTFINATVFAHYSKPIHIGAATEPTDASLEVTGNIKATGDIGFSGNLSKVYNGVEHVIFNSPTTNFGIIGIGKDSMPNATGGDNVAIGSNTLINLTTGSLNTAVGSQALNVTTGSANTAVGKASGAGNITGTHNTFIGFDTKVSSNGPIKSTAIGWAATITESNQIVLGTSTEKVFIEGKLGIGNTPSEKLEVTGNIKASGDIIFTGDLKKDDGSGGLTDFQGGAFSIEAGGFAHYSDNIHIGGSTEPADGSKLEVTGDIKVSGVIRQW